jgi:hypothetical protein
MTINEMTLRRLRGVLFAPKIEGLFAVDGGLRISVNSLKTWRPGTELNPPTPAFSVLRYIVF